MQNCSYDFDQPAEFTALPQSFADAALYQKNGEKPGGITIYRPDGERLDREILYRKALLEGHRMLTQVEPPPAMDFTRVHFGYGQAIYDAWVRQLEQANAENSEVFYFASPVFPHFLALYENRFQLCKFLKMYADMIGNENLSKAAGLCAQLKDLAVEAAQIGYENEYSKPEILALTHNERRVLLIDLLKRCRALELEIAEQIGIFADLPESYSPKMPEILTAAKTAADAAAQKAEETNATSGTAPRIVNKAFRLVGAKGNVGSVWPNFGPLLEDLYKTVRDRLGLIEGLAKPVRMVGFWHMDALASGEREYCYFAGVEALCENPPEGLAIKTLPESCYAVFTEQRRGTIGSPGGYAYKQWLPASEYEGNAEVPGDFEIYNNMTETGPECEAEIWIPVTPKQPPEGYGPKKPEILSMAEQAAPGQQENGLSENMLPGIPPMRYGDPSPVCFIGTLMRLMDFMHDPIDQDELFALSGTALCFPWREASNCDEVSIIPEIPQRTFAALGYACEHLYEPDISVSPRKHTKDVYIEKIKRSVDNGRPVVGFGFTHQNYTCLITGYYNGGNGLYLRAFWTPEGAPDGYDTADHYYATEAWYETCHGIVVVGEKTGARLSGPEAYRRIQESAHLFAGKRSVELQGMEYAMGAFSFDRMRDWLLDDAGWRELTRQEVFLKPCGLLLLDYYRANLREYLKRLDRHCPGIVSKAAIAALARLGESFPGNRQSQLHLDECVDASITDFSMLQDRSVREKVAAYVERLRDMDREIFACLIGTEEKSRE